jgi:transcriptional antiterminator RfaH
MDTIIGHRGGGLSPWYVLETKPHKEAVVLRQLLHHNLEAFYPQLRAELTRYRKSGLKPYFPRYLFVRADVKQIGLSRFQHIPHALGLVCVGSEPAAVADPLVRAIQHRIQELAARRTAGDGLRRGDHVTIRGGPFEGYEALFDVRVSGGERVRVLLQVLGRPSLAVEMSTAYIRPN